MNHIELAAKIREMHESSQLSIRQVHEETRIDSSYLYCFFRDNQPVYFDILNRLANFYSLEYQISNATIVTKPDVYIDNILDLIRYLRESLWAADNITKISKKTNLKESHLHDFRKGKAICLMKMDALCLYYSIIYKIKNYPEELTQDLPF